MPGILCEHCTAACCRYVALPIETPDTRSEFDDIRWYLLHENISVFVEDDEWYISMATPCRHLQADHRCGIYTTRPQICRKYTTENCDYHSGDYGWEHHFTCPEHLDEYMRNVFNKNSSNSRVGQKSRTSSQDRKAGESGQSRVRRTSLKAKVAGPGRARRRRTDDPLADARADIAGVPLPVLRSGQ